VPKYLFEDGVLNRERFLCKVIAFSVLCANQSFICRRGEARRNGGGRKELGVSVKTTLALPDEESHNYYKNNHTF